MVDEQEYFKLNGIDVGFSERTDVSVRCGRIRMHLHTPALRLTRELDNGLSQTDWKPISNAWLKDGLAIFPDEDIAIPGGKYGHTFTFPYTDETRYLRRLSIRAIGSAPEFFGTVTIDEGWLTLSGVAAHAEKVADIEVAMPIEVRKRFVASPLIPRRKKLSLAAAKKLPPDEVFWVAVENNARVNSFPKEILNYRNLEDLWLSCAFDGKEIPLPEALFDLRKLHTLNLQWAFFTIGALSPRFGDLSALEVVRLANNRITTLPDEIVKLKKLETIDVTGNLLATLPSEIGNMQALRHLDARWNPFISLPKSLANISKVEVSYPQKSLYLDTRYRPDMDVAVDHESFLISPDTPMRSALAAALDAASDDSELKQVILDYSTRALLARAIATKSPSPIGMSKIGGTPDLPVGLAHPVDENGLLYAFYAQINLSSIADSQPWLPRHGMLYFFVADAGYGDGPIVLYAPGTNLNLARFEYAADARWIDGDIDVLFPEYQSPTGSPETQIEFCEAISLPYLYGAPPHRYPNCAHRFARDAKLLNRISRFNNELDAARRALAKQLLVTEEHSHSINGHTFSDDLTPQEHAAQYKGGDAQDWMPLLTLNSSDGLNFGDAGTLTFSIHKKDLFREDFSNVVATRIN